MAVLWHAGEMGDDALAAARADPGHWSSYNQAMRGRAVRRLCTDVLGLAGPAQGRTALDLGCGTGTEVKALLDAGWNVVALDSAPDVRQLVLDTAGEHDPERLTIVAADLTQTRELPQSHLVHSSLALPFLDPLSFHRVWQMVRECLLPGGWLAVSLFGDRDSWAPNQDMTFLTAEAARGLFDGLDLLSFEEIQEDRPAYMQDSKHWHLFEVIARQPRRAGSYPTPTPKTF